MAPLQRDDRQRHRSRSCSPVSPEGVGATHGEREERWLAEAAMLVGPPAGQPRAASADTGLSTQEPEPAEVTAPAAPTASPASPPRERAPDMQREETAAPASHAAAPTAAPGTPPTLAVAPAQELSASPRAAAAAEGSGEGVRGVATAAPASRATTSAGLAAAPSTPRKRGTDAARATGASPAAAAAAAVGREGAKYRAQANPTHTHTSSPKLLPPKPFPPGRTRHVRAPAPEGSPPGVTLPQLQTQQDAWRVIQEGGDGAQAELRASQGSAERGTGGDRGGAQGHAQRAGQGTRGKQQGRKHGRGDTEQGAGKGPGHGKGVQGRGQGAQVHGAERVTVGEQGGQGVGGRERDPPHGQGHRGVGAGGGPKGNGKDATAPRDRRDGAWEPGGRAGQREGGGGRGAPAAGRAASEVHPPRHATDAGATTTTTTSTTSTLPPESSSPPHPQDPSTSQPPPHRERSRRGWPRRGVGRGMAPAPQAQGQQGGPARGAEGARPWDRDWGTVPDPLGDEALPLVGEVYGWLSWANHGTTRGLRNRPCDAVLLRTDGGNREVPPGGWAAPEDHERVLRSVIRAAWPNRGPTWPAFLEGGAVLRITDAEADNWLPQALRSALAHWRYRRRNPPPPQPQPLHKRRRRWRPRRRTRESGGGGWAPRPTPPPRYGVTGERAPPPARGRAETTSTGGNLRPRSSLTADR